MRVAEQASSVPELIFFCKLIFFIFGGKKSLIEICASVLGAIQASEALAEGGP